MGNENTVKDLEILEKYLDSYELKEIAKEQARKVFNEHYNNQKNYIFTECAKEIMGDEIGELIKENKSIIQEKTLEVLGNIKEWDVRYHGKLDEKILDIFNEYKDQIKEKVVNHINENFLGDNDYIGKIADRNIEYTIIEIVESALKLKFSDGDKK